MPVRRHTIARSNQKRNVSRQARIQAQRKSSREVFYGAGSFAVFIRSRAEELGGKQGSRVSKEEVKRLLVARNWSSLDPLVRRTLMARSIRENADLADSLGDNAALKGLGDRIRVDVRRKLKAKGIGQAGSRPALPTKPSTRLPEPPPAPTPNRRKPHSLKTKRGAKEPVPPPVEVSPPKAPKPIPRQSEPEPPVRVPRNADLGGDAEESFESAIGYFVSLSRVGYYTEEPPVRVDNPVVYDFATEPDGFLRLGPGETWASPWYEGEILRGMSVDVIGDYRLSYISNGSFES